MTTENTQQPASQTIEFPPIDQLSWDAVRDYDYSTLIAFVSEYAMQFVTALAIFFVGKWIVRRLVNIVKRGLEKSKMDATLIDFLGSILFGIGVLFVIVAAMSQLGIDTTSFAAAIAAAGLAIGLALQGSLSNFAAGFLIILFGFFKKGHYVEVGGTSGTVKEISIFTTTLLTPDNRTVIVPNSNITTDVIINYTKNKRRRLDMIIGVAYDADLQKAQKLLRKIVMAHEGVLETPEAVVEVNELGASSVDFVVRPWVKTGDYWTVKWELTKQIKIELDKAGVGIPFPQRDVNLFVKDGDLSVAKSKKKNT